MEGKVKDLLSKVGIGYDSIVSELSIVENNFSSLDLNAYLPYSIIKTSPTAYVLEVNVAGYKRKNLSVVLSGLFLVVSGTKEPDVDPEGDNVIQFAGKKSNTKFSMRFAVADYINVVDVEYKHGILKVKFEDVSSQVERHQVFEIGPKNLNRLNRNFEYNNKGEPVGIVIKEESEDDETEQTPSKEVVFYTEKEEVPQIVEVSVKEETDKVVVEYKDATYEVVSDEVETTVIKTPENKSDIVMATPKKVKEKLDAFGIDPKANLEKALAAEIVVPSPAPEVPQTPNELAIPTEKLEVKTPEVLSPVVEAVLEQKEDGEKPTVILIDASEDVAKDGKIVPVVTAKEQNDVVVVVPSEVSAKLDEAGIDVATDVGKALVEANVAVHNSNTVPTESEVASDDEFIQGLDVITELTKIMEAYSTDKVVVEEPKAVEETSKEVVVSEVLYEDPPGPAGPAIEPVKTKKKRKSSKKKTSK